MIRYALACDAGHRFESWFGSSAAFDVLARQGLVSCPDCGSTHVGKTIMAPAVARRDAGHGAGGRDGEAQAAPPSEGPPPTPRSPFGDAPRELRALLRAMRSKVLAGTEDVGARFPAEARRMHEGDIPHRDIRGEATLDEARALLEDGVVILPVPGGADELN